MTNLPAGTVTFLFTDIEGSTRLLQEHPRDMGDALSRHHDLLREAVEANKGIGYGGQVLVPALRKSIGAEAYAEEAHRQNAWLQSLYAVLGEKACAEARAIGRAMSVDQAIDEAVAR